MRTLLLGAFFLAACATSADPITSPEADPSGTTPVPGDAACKHKSECTKGGPCTIAKCEGGKCSYDPMTCETNNECAQAACDPVANTCKTTPKADGSDCNLGECIAGKCEAMESCFGESPQHFLHCDGASSWYRDASTTLYPKSRVAKYACATGEVAAEMALEFDPPAGSSVTASLQVTGGPDANLNLLILEDQCFGNAACMNPALAGGARAGVTPGTGTESVTFTAVAGKKYYVVVDGKVTSPVSFHVEVACQ